MASGGAAPGATYGAATGGGACTAAIGAVFGAVELADGIGGCSGGCAVAGGATGCVTGGAIGCAGPVGRIGRGAPIIVGAVARGYCATHRLRAASGGRARRGAAGCAGGFCAFSSAVAM